MDFRKISNQPQPRRVLWSSWTLKNTQNKTKKFKFRVWIFPVSRRKKRLLIQFFLFVLTKSHKRESPKKENLLQRLLNRYKWRIIHEITNEKCLWNGAKFMQMKRERNKFKTDKFIQSWVIHRESKSLFIGWSSNWIWKVCL